MTSAATEHRLGRALVLQDTLVPNAKQEEFSRVCDGRHVEEILFDGAIRSGKSFAAAKKMLAWAMATPGLTFGAFRSTYRELEDSTKRVFLRGEGGLPAAIPPQLIRRTYEGERNKVVLVNGSEILFRSLEPDNRGVIRGLTLAGGFIDQAEEFDEPNFEDFYEELRGRLSEPGSKMLVVANPGAADHWVCQRFGCTPEAEMELDEEARRTRRRVHVTLADNRANLDPDFFAQLMRTERSRPLYFRRMVLGEWGVTADRRFEGFDPRPGGLNVVRAVIDIPDGWEIVEGLDYGWADPFVCTWFAVDWNGAWWAVAEHRQARTRISEHAKVIKAVRQGADMPPDVASLRPFAGKLAPSVSFIDPSAWNKRGEYASAAQELSDYGIYTAKAYNERIGGWNRLDEFLAERMPDGHSRLRLFPTLRWLSSEISGARVREGTDDIVGRNDHSLDTARYALMSRLGPAKTEEEGPDPFSKEERVRRILESVPKKKEDLYLGDE